MSSQRRHLPTFPLGLDALERRSQPRDKIGERDDGVETARALTLQAVRPTSAPAVAPKPQTAAGHASATPKLQPTAAAARALLRPQRLLADAHGDAQRRHAPSGLGLDSEDVRRRMVERLRAARATTDEAVLNAMAAVPRHLFVDGALVTQAYEDTSLPIGHGQTISKPSVIARMIGLLMQGSNARRTGSLGQTLEIGTGCGYQAAVLALLARQIISIERLKQLHDRARQRAFPARPSNLRYLYADGMLGHAAAAPYDSIISAAGGDALPDGWLAQLAVGGRLVSPMREFASERQTLMVVDRTEQGYERHAFEAVRFVPLKSGLAAG